jgi:hypothetical protein
MSLKERNDFAYPSETRQSWTAPPEGWLKLNTDAAFNSDRGEARTGIVARNDLGERW